MLVAVLKGISDGLSRGKKTEEMEQLVNMIWFELSLFLSLQFLILVGSYQWDFLQAKDLWRANMGHPQASEVVNKDIISHFVLRLVYCRT